MSRDGQAQHSTYSHSSDCAPAILGVAQKGALHDGGGLRVRAARAPEWVWLVLGRMMILPDESACCAFCASCSPECLAGYPRFC